MAKRNAQDKKNFEAWLLNFERQAGRPVVVSLLIEEGSIDFVSVVRKKVYLNAEDSEDPDESPPTIDFEKAKKLISDNHLKLYDYIG